jgi:hypothetical protein
VLKIGFRTVLKLGFRAVLKLGFRVVLKLGFRAHFLNTAPKINFNFQYNNTLSKFK